MQIETVTRTPPGGRAMRLVGLGALLLGLALLGGAGLAAWYEIAFRRGAVETEGRVVEMIRSTGSRDRDGRRSDTWRPVFVFALPGGKEVRAEGGVASNPPCCRVGDRVRVRYDPAHPERAAMTGFVESWLVASILGGAGVIFAGLGLALRRMRGGAAAGAEAGAATFAVPLAGLRRADGRWVVQARWADPRSGAQRLFESDPLPFDPVPRMRSMTAVAVRFDPGQPDGPYHMDLSFLDEPDADATVVQRR